MNQQNERMIDKYLVQMLELGGSDLHLTTGLPAKFRVHGDLQAADERILDADAMRDMLHDICYATRWDYYLTHHDIDFAYEIHTGDRFRVNCLYDHHGMGAVLRHIPSRIKTLEELHMPEVLKEMCEIRNGLILVTGPTGSGKSTTLAAMINYINESSVRNIITIEDPVEFVHKHKRSVISHREVGVHTHSFPQALRGAMRSDPDIVLIGEMRDLETIKMGLTCSSMGMLVFGTLHTNSASKTVDRIIDAFPANEQAQIRTLLAESLQGIVSQLLCRKKGGGRTAVHEILLWTDGLANSIREGQIANIRTIIEGNKGRGMVTMDGSIMTQFQAGNITAEEAYMKGNDKKMFLPLIEKAAESEKKG